MFLKRSIKKMLAERGYKHWVGDDEFTCHGVYARNIQYAFSKEFVSPGGKVVDIFFLAVDVRDEKMVLGFLREDLAIEKGVMENSSLSIPLAKFSLEEFEKQLNRLIPKKDPAPKTIAQNQKF